jgi:hypothetical protein
MIGYNVGNVKLWESRDDGETWSQIGTTIPTYNRANQFLISPKDSNLMVACVADPFTVLRSTNGFLSWNTVLGDSYGEFTIPIEMHPDRPDTLLFAGDSVAIKRSTDFGSTWSPYSVNVFREPDDLAILPDSSNVVIVGDGVTLVGNEQIYQSTDGGVNFTVKQTGTDMASEVPTIATSRLRNTTVFATNWSTGGMLRSQDAGVTWAQVTPAPAAWGVDIAADDPNLVTLGPFTGGGGQTYISIDGGSTFSTVPLSGANYAMYARDRATILAQQSTGVWKMSFAYAFTPNNAQSVTVTAPNGGEIWSPGQTRSITWTPTGIALARIEYRTAPAQPWQLIADVDGYTGRYDWLIPQISTTHAQVRVSDAWDASPTDLSNAEFTINEVVGVEAGSQAGLELAPARPNPFDRSTAIQYRLPARGPVRLEVFDVRGERVAVLVNGVQEAGTHFAMFEAGRAGRGGIASGVYFVRLSAGPLATTRKILLLR